MKGKVKISRPEKFGGDVEFEFYEDLERQFTNKEIHPLDLKTALSAELIEIFSKVRKYFEEHRDELESLGSTFLS